VSAEAIISMKNLLRKFPDFHGRIIHGIGAFLKSIDEPDAKVHTPRAAAHAPHGTTVAGCARRWRCSG